MPTPPFPPSPGYAVAWAYPSNSFASGPSYLFGGAQSGNGTVGVDDVGNSFGKCWFTGSCGVCDWTVWACYYNFAAPTLPPGVGGISGLYLVCDAETYQLDTFGMGGVLEMQGSPSSFNPATISWPSFWPFNGPPLNTGASPGLVTVYTPSLGTDLSILPNCRMAGRFLATMGGADPGYIPTLQFQNPRIAIYYQAPVMPIGHGANCNAYDPISVSAGATTPPGNGLLIR